MVLAPRKFRQLPPALPASDADVFPVSQMDPETGRATTRAMTRPQLNADLVAVINAARQEFVDTANAQHQEIYDAINALQISVEQNELNDSAISNALVTLQMMIESGESGKTPYDLWLEAGNTGTLQDYFLSLKGPPGTTSWSGITDKPTQYNPAPHTHALEDVVGLGTALDEKADVVHTHNQGDIIGLDEALDAKVDRIKYAKTHQTNASGLWSGPVPATATVLKVSPRDDGIVQQSITQSGGTVTIQFRRLNMGGLGLSLGNLLSANILAASVGVVTFDLEASEPTT